MTVFFLHLIFALIPIICSAYDTLEGLGVTSRPCVPVHKHPTCNRSLWDVYSPRIKGRDGNTPKTKMYLFTAKSPDKAEQLHECAGGLPPDSTFNPEHPTEVFLHGYSDSMCRTAWQKEMKAQLFLRGNYNVILTDWTWGNFPDVVTAALNTKVVGQQMAYVLRKIARQTKYDCKKFHATGNSYGVNVASVTGKFMKGRCKLGRLTALDPALPPFKYTAEEDNLNTGDAEFVDVIHTGGGKCFPLAFGDPRPVGHVDFYVNDGSHQYSCIPYALQSLLKLDLFYGLASLFLPLCFHVQSIQYYKVSINAVHFGDKQFIGVECNSLDDFLSGSCSRNCDEGPTKCLVMGLDIPLYRNESDTKRRIYHVPASFNCPYIDQSGFTGLPLKKINAADDK